MKFVKSEGEAAARIAEIRAKYLMGMLKTFLVSFALTFVYIAKRIISSILSGSPILKFMTLSFGIVVWMGNRDLNFKQYF